MLPGINPDFASSPLCRQSNQWSLDMNRFREDEIVQDNHPQPAGDGIDRRNFLGCMAWAGTGLLWTMAGGVPASKLLAQAAKSGTGLARQRTSPSSRSATVTSASIKARIRMSPARCRRQSTRSIWSRPASRLPDFMIHTGDITQNSKASEFDTAAQVIKSTKVGEVFYVPGEHDFSLDDGALYKQRFGKGHHWQWLVQLQPQRRPLCWAEQLRAGRCDGQPGRGAACMVEVRPRRVERFHANRRLRPHPAVDGLREVGLGNRGWRTGARPVQALRLSDAC